MKHRSRRFIFFGIMVLVGMAAGVLYGWVINPIQFTSSKPRSLRIDYQTDFVLMVAELYHHDHDLGQAASYLTYLGDAPWNSLMDEAVSYAEQQAYAPVDIEYMNTLALAINLALPGE